MAAYEHSQQKTINKVSSVIKTKPDRLGYGHRVNVCEHGVHVRT